MLAQLLLLRRPRRAGILRELAAQVAPGDVDRVVIEAARAEVRLQLESLVRARLVARAEVSGLERLPRDGAVVMLSHVGHHALAGPLLARHGLHPIEVALSAGELSGRLPSASTAGGWFRALVERRERGLGVERTDATRWLGPAVKGLAAGRLVVWPGDAALGSRTLTLPFLGRPWPFPTGGARAAVVAEKPLVYAHVVRGAAGVHTLRLSAPISPPASGSSRASRGWVQDTMAGFVAGLERVVRANPELYLWRMATMIDLYGAGSAWGGG